MEYAIYRFLSAFFSVMGIEDERIPLEIHPIGSVTVYHVTEDELERLESESSDLGLDFNVSLACVVAAISIFATLISSPAPPPSAPSIGRIACWVMVPVLLVMWMIFGFRWHFHRRGFSKIIAKIRARQVGPLGDEKREINAQELKTLVPEPAPEAPKDAAGIQETVSMVVKPAQTEGTQK